MENCRAKRISGTCALAVAPHNIAVATNAVANILAKRIRVSS